jgi:hypothetical protein
LEGHLPLESARPKGPDNSTQGDLKVKRTIAFTILAGLAMTPQLAKASAFGFKAGMTRQELIAALGAQSLKNDDHDDGLTFTRAPNPHPDFDEYFCVVSPKTGLVKVIAAGENITTDNLGSELKEKLSEVQAAITKTYGPPKSTYDFLNEGSIWNQPEDWMMGLLKKDRTVATYWIFPTPQDHIAAISVEAVPLNRETGYILVSYEFDGFHEYVTSRKQKRNDAF